MNRLPMPGQLVHVDPGDLVKFRRGRVAHIVGRPTTDRIARTVCGQVVTLDDQPALVSDPICVACDKAPPTRKPPRAAARLS